MSVWFSSDLHFGHVRILEFGRSKFFDDLDHMREMIIQSWNTQVDPDDTVYLLGDLVMGKRDQNLPHINRLNGNKILILGNHDYPHRCNSPKFWDKWTDIYGEVVDEMHHELEITLSNGQNVLLCHFPASGDHTEEERFSEFRPDYDGVIIHGHLHCEDIWVAPNHIHIGIDSDWGLFGVDRFHPIPESAVIEAIETMNDTHWSLS